MKIREIYTVIRETEIDDLEEERGHLLHILDDTGEFLYGGGCGEESLSVKFQIYNNNEWQDFDPEN